MKVDGERTWVVLSRSQPFSNCPEKSGLVRVDDFLQSCAMQSDGKVGAKGVYVCMYVCIYVSMYVSMYLCMYVSMYLILYTNPFICLSIYLYPAFMHYYDNPKGSIPTWLINWACKVIKLVMYYSTTHPLFFILSIRLVYRIF